MEFFTVVAQDPGPESVVGAHSLRASAVEAHSLRASAALLEEDADAHNPPTLSAFLVTTAAALMRSRSVSGPQGEQQSLAPTPGTLLADAVTLGLQAAAESGAAHPAHPTVSHFVVAVPHVWANGVPQLTEPPGEVSLHDGDSGPFPGSRLALGRITTVAQLIALTDAEFEYAQREGSDAVLQAIADAGADPRDLCRESVI
ncbi:suppressor of fused domain protein [Corynebacterium sp. TAE3-ERU12]|uniref:suppressor of fused domain protein n=1 Tax=Corynebacterium sp. TAE3-ERU12 TaxID=2849491 RepID=UPI001C46DE48|nr:suppressor of fused domain protein [Corynebacterium sp. TAE3-ERU12]MBV7294438.1 suppressor of fused domain protein [Corynebacterium sp. TAE3-ERU12]